VKGDDAVLIVHGLVHNEPVWRLLAIQNGGAEVFLLPLCRSSARRTEKKKQRREEIGQKKERKKENSIDRGKAR
jgi:hypothetical protein